MDVIRELRGLYREFSDNPYEYVARATREEHRELAQIFARLLDLVCGMFNRATEEFRQGAVEFAADPGIVEVRDQLSERSEGRSATSMFLAKFFKGGELNTGSEEQSGQGQEEQKEAEADSAAAGGPDAQHP